MKLPRRQFLHLAAGAAALPAVSRIAWAQAYPTRPVRIIVAVRRRRRDRHHRAPDGSMAVGAARPAIRHREPAGRRQQYRHRGGRACAAGRLHAPHGQLRRTRSTRRSTTSSISISSATSRRSRASSASPSSWWSIHRFRPRRFPSSSPMPRPIRARSTWRRPASELAGHVAGELFKMMAGVDMVHVPYRGGGARADRPARRTGAGLVRHHVASSIEYIRAGKLRALAVTTATRSEALPDIPTVGEFVPGYEASAWYRRRRAQEHACRDRRQAQQGDQRRPRRSQDQGAACRPGRHAACGLARRLRQAHRRRNREVGQGDPGGQHQAGLSQPDQYSVTPVPRMLV